MIKQLLGSFDPNKTVQHLSFREARMQHERQMKLSDRIFGALALSTLVAFFIIAIVLIMAQG